MYLDRITERERILSEALTQKDTLEAKLNQTSDEIQKKRIQMLNNSDDLDRFK